MSGGFDLKNVSIDKIQRFTGFRHVEYQGLNLKADECVIYDNCGIGIYYKGERLAFIECKNFDVSNFGKFHTAIKYNCHKGIFSQDYIYLRYREIGEDEDKEEEKESNFIKDNLKVGDKVIRMYNEDHSPKSNPNEKYSDSYLIFCYYSNKKEDALNNLDFFRQEFEWEVTEIIDSLMAKISRNGVEELCLLTKIETLNTLIHNAEELLKGLADRRNKR